MANPLTRIETKTILSTLWIYVLLNLLFRDVHEIFRDGSIEELANAGTVNGVQVTQTTLIISGLLLQLPLAMVILSRLLRHRTNRIANVLIAAVTSLGVVGTWPKDADEILFGIFQVAGLLAIIAISVRWSQATLRPQTESPVPG